MKKKVAIGLSGGIDSSVSAYLLKKRGFEVIGFTLKFHPRQNRCCDLDSLNRAKRLCYELDIPHYTISAGQLFKKEIIDYFIDSYLKGLTPNPCVYCNRLIKFGLFWEKVKSFNIDYLATGHYARLGQRGGGYFLRTNKDLKKTQEYFLCLVKPRVLKNIIFPLANYTKKQVKKIALKNKIVFKLRKESQDLCFAENRSYAEFIKDNISKAVDYCGDIVHIKGKVLGRHRGIYNYTYGQRSGMGIGWSQPLYVLSIDPKHRKIIVGEKKFLERNSFKVSSLNWFLDPKKYKNIKVKPRYNTQAKKCSLEFEGPSLRVTFKEKCQMAAPGQVAAFYYKDILLGGGIIDSFT